jgi:hypothetical protein
MITLFVVSNLHDGIFLYAIWNGQDTKEWSVSKYKQELQVGEINGLTRTPRYTRGGIRCLRGVSIPCQSVAPTLNSISNAKIFTTRNICDHEVFANLKEFTCTQIKDGLQWVIHVHIPEAWSYTSPWGTCIRKDTCESTDKVTNDFLERIY